MSSHQRPLLPKLEGDIGPNASGNQNRNNAAFKKKRGASVDAACGACRQRRSKCDGQRPTCSACTARNIQCEYEFAPGQSRTTAQKLRIDRAEANNTTLVEILWYLKSRPIEEAQQFLEYIKSDDRVGVSSMYQWIRNKLSDNQPASMPLSEMRELLSPSSSRQTDSERASSVSASPEKADGIKGSTATGMLLARDAVPRGEDLRQAATVSTIGAAVHMFFQCTGTLFYVFSKDQAHTTYKEAFGDIENPDETSILDIFTGDISSGRGAQYAELCGMAAVGLLYIRVADKEISPPALLADYLYSTAKLMLDRSIEVNPLRAMKVCALLVEYNIVLKSTVALAYVELGLGLGRCHGLGGAHPPTSIDEEDLRDYKRTWRTLTMFSGWLSASLGYVSDSSSRAVRLPEPGDDMRPEDLIQAELVKVTSIKAYIIREIPSDRIVNDLTISNFRKELKMFYEQLPDWMSISNLAHPHEDKTDPKRPVVFYLHLFYLSAMQLLHRRTIDNLAEFASSPQELTQEANEAIKEGLMASKMAARVLGLMRQEGTIVQICWMCIYTSFTTGIIILQAAIQKVFNNFHTSLWIADLTLVNVCIETLDYCAQVDEIAARFKNILQQYLQVITDAVNGEIHGDASRDNEEFQSIAYLLSQEIGDTDLHKAASDLFRLVRRPFCSSLQLLPELDWSSIHTHSTLLNWAEAAAGGALEWTWEMQACGLPPRKGDALDIVSNSTPGRFITPSESAWSTWTPPAF